MSTAIPTPEVVRPAGSCGRRIVPPRAPARYAAAGDAGLVPYNMQESRGELKVGVEASAATLTITATATATTTYIDLAYRTATCSRDAVTNAAARTATAWTRMLAAATRATATMVTTRLRL